MSQPEIRIMTKSDIDFVIHLQEIAGWGNTRADAERNLYYEPYGCFIASVKGNDVGVVNSFLYGDVGFIGNLIVLPEIRSQGIGEALMRKAMDRLTSEGVKTIRLDGVQKAIPLYERLGFKGEYWSLRYRGTASKAPHKGVDPIKKEDLDEVASLDRRFFGLNRLQKLQKIYYDYPDLCFKISKIGKIYGYIMAKPGATNIRVGPWICDPLYGDFAEPLLNAIESKTEGRSIWIGLPEFNTNAVNIIEKKGYNRIPPSLRMCYGSCKNIEDVSGIFGIGAPDKG